jgi:hypothetical protein
MRSYPPARLSLPVPVRRFVTLDEGLAAWQRASHNLRRALACAVAEHLQRAALLLEQPRGVDVLVLGAARTAEVLDALDAGARQCGTVLPVEVAASAERLRAWARTLKQPPSPAAWPLLADADSDLPALPAEEQP